MTVHDIRRVLAPAALAALLAAVAGCAGDRPRSRVGCLPYPHSFTFFTVADPDDLGMHQYVAERFGNVSRETERGIVYTCRAGFLDVAHIRETIDWSWYASRQIEPALRDGAETLTIQGRDLTSYELRFRYPAFWSGLDEATRQELITELSRRIGQQVGYAMLTWHEIITWFGYKTWIVIPEDPSAFTYEDVMSHVVGLRVVDRAMRDEERPYDEAVTHALTVELQELGVLSSEETSRLVELVNGRWWRGDESLVRHLDIGLEKGVVRPLLVPGVEGCDDHGERPVFALPSLEDVAGRDLRGIYELRLDSLILEWNDIRGTFDPPPQRLVPAEHFPGLIARIRREMGL